ncbi:hypothetical protein V6N13_055697 [Hibiscus sabdariffa]
MVRPRHLEVAWSRDQPLAPWEAALAGLSWSGNKAACTWRGSAWQADLATCTRCGSAWIPAWQTALAALPTCLPHLVLHQSGMGLKPERMHY